MQSAVIGDRRQYGFKLTLTDINSDYMFVMVFSQFTDLARATGKFSYLCRSAKLHVYNWMRN